MKNCVIFDLDGTLCDVEHRRQYVRVTPKNWDAFNKACALDTPNPHVLNLFKMIRSQSVFDITVIFCSGRSDEFEKETLFWLNKHLGEKEHILHMRKSNDRRQDSIVKKEMLDEIRNQGFNVMFVVDDRPSVLRMWRENGVPTFAVGDLEEF